MADREELVRMRRNDLLTYEDYFLNHAVLFLAGHLKCNLGAVDENGKKYDVMPKPPPRPRIVR